MVLRPLDPRDVIYTKTRPRKPSTDQSLRRPPYRAIFNKTILGLTRQVCVHNVTSPPWPDQYLDLSPI
ncbi:hypothetical protein TNCV_3725011 [Trichonephila clavipes]|nr:hypothetical protein TNCV_3725011 [Trichonephila clavipes]